MKIVFCSAYFLPHKGGVENYVLQISKRLVKKGHDVFVVTSRLKDMAEEEHIEGIKVIRIPAWDVLKDRIPVQVGLFSALSKIKDIDVLVTNTRFYLLSFFAGIYSKLHKIPWLHIEHGTKQVDYSNLFIRYVSRVVDFTIGRWILRNAVVSGVSQCGSGCARLGPGQRQCRQDRRSQRSVGHLFRLERQGFGGSRENGSGRFRRQGVGQAH